MTPEQRAIWLAGRTKHGAYSGGMEKPEHYVWRTMLTRCNNPTSQHYKYYGARGITVCKRWLKYENFIIDMGDRPTPKHSLERLNNNQGYKPSNCVWALASEQQRNKSSTYIYKGPNFSGTLVECANYLGLSKELAWWRWRTWGALIKGEKWLRQKKTPLKNK